jgi:hypothetical protein
MNQWLNVLLDYLEILIFFPELSGSRFSDKVYLGVTIQVPGPYEVVNVK